MEKIIEITPEEGLFCKYQIRQLGSFYTQLIQTMLLADDNNLGKLRLAFPELVDVVYRYGHEVGYFESLVKRWNKAYPHCEIIT